MEARKIPPLRGIADETGTHLSVFCKFCNQSRSHGRCANWLQHLGPYRICDCPIGSGDGHRRPHCQHWPHGYRLREVGPEPDQRCRAFTAYGVRCKRRARRHDWVCGLSHPTPGLRSPEAAREARLRDQAAARRWRLELDWRARHDQNRKSVRHAKSNKGGVS